MLEQCYHHLQEPTERIRAGLVEAEVAHNDETGLYVQGQRRGLHVMSNRNLTYYEHHLKRGKAATDEIGLLPLFKGTSVHDSWSPYWGYEDCDHALCNAHLLRELIFVVEQMHQEWASGLKDLLLEVKERVERAQKEGHHELNALTLDDYKTRYESWLVQGLAANPALPQDGWSTDKRGRPKQSMTKNLIDRMQERWREVLLSRMILR